MAQNEQPPEVCFGKWWEASEVKCAGGLDPTYVNKLDGTHKRDRCKWYQSCASRTTTSRLGSPNQPQPQPQPQMNQPAFSRPPVQAQQQQPSWQAPLQSLANGALYGAATALARQEPAKVPVRVFGQPQQYPQPQYPQYAYPQYQQQYPQGSMAPPWAAMLPQMVPMNYQAPGAQMPAYLTVPEPVVPGVHWGYRLGFSVLRSIFKASGHTLSNFFDFTPINPWPAPPPMLPPGTNMP